MLSLTMNGASGSPIPAAKIRTLQNGTVRISVGNFVGTAPSMHLTEQRIQQLRSHWLKAHHSSQI